jgi:predicted nucleic acid-binding protein
MSFLLDTCVLSEIVKPEPNNGLVLWLSQQNANTLFISSLALGELQKGIAKLAKGKRKSYLDDWLSAQVVKSFQERVLPLDAEIALNWGVYQAEMEAMGKPLPLMDSLIAATAKTHHLTLVTRNMKDMKLGGLKLLNPWS